MKRLLLAGCLAALLTIGCAPSTPPAPEKPPVDPMALRTEANSLPAARIDEAEPMRLVYPQGALFSEGAALFYAGGAETLDPLAAFLLRHPDTRWRGTARATSPVSVEHALALARMRAHLLGRYLVRKGIAAERLDIQGEEGAGPDLELRLQTPAQPPSASSSSREKR